MTPAMKTSVDALMSKFAEQRGVSSSQFSYSWDPESKGRYRPKGCVDVKFTVDTGRFDWAYNHAIAKRLEKDFSLGAYSYPSFADDKPSRPQPIISGGLRFASERDFLMTLNAFVTDPSPKLELPKLTVARQR